MNALFIKDLTIMTHRGQCGRVEAGKAGSGQAAHGYRVVHQFDDNGEPIRGERTIVEDEAEIIARMAQAPADVQDVHPNIANAYRRNVERFTEGLNDPDGGREAAKALRSLIGEIVLLPDPKRGEVHTELRGELKGILTFATDQKAEQTIRIMPPVASFGDSLPYDYRFAGASGRLGAVLEACTRTDYTMWEM